MDATYSEHISTSFVIGPEQLQSFAKLLEQHIGPVKVIIKCADSLSRELDSVSDVIQYENPRSKQIVELRISARSSDSSGNASIDFSGSKWRGVSIEFRGDEDSVSKLKMGTMEIIDGCRPWYGPIQSIDFVSISLAAVFCLFFYAMVVTAFKKARHPTPKSSATLTVKQNAVGQLTMLGILAVIFTVGPLSNWLRDLCFPRAVFAIGQGNARFLSLERFQWGFLIAILASLIASVLLLFWQTWHNKASDQRGESAEIEMENRVPPPGKLRR